MTNQIDSRELAVTGMTCDRCAHHVVSALEVIEGVVSARIPGWSSGKVEITLSADVDAAELIAAVSAAGYGASIPEGAPMGDGSDGPDGPDVFDLVVIGGGSAAFAAAIKASELGRRVVIVNAGADGGGLPTGGTCVNVGCVPSKATMRAAEAVHRARGSAFDGVTTTGQVTDFGALMRQVQTLVADLRQEKYVRVVQDDPLITFVEGVARLAGVTGATGATGATGTTGGVHTIDIDGQPSLRARNILIATGARTKVPDIPGLEEVGYLTNEDLYKLEEQPSHLIVLGGGYVGIENAQAFARLGSRVTLLQRAARLFPAQSADLTDALTGFLRADGVVVQTGVTTRSVHRDGNDIAVHITLDGRDEVVRGSHLLVATGRRGNTEGLGLDTISIEPTRHGFLTVDATLRTAVPTVFAAGDVLGENMFVYTAAYEGALAARNALQQFHIRRDYRALPWVVFTDPQVAGVGLDEAQAIEAGLEVDVATLPMEAVPRAIAARDTRGFVRLVRERSTDRIVGARILAPEGSELLMQIVHAIRHGTTTLEIAETFHPYLTLSEAVKLAAIAFRKDISKLSCCAA